MVGHPVSSIEIETKNNDDGSILSICTASTLTVVTPDNKKGRNSYKKTSVKKTYVSKVPGDNAES